MFIFILRQAQDERKYDEIHWKIAHGELVEP
jgi:hypothetical protein